MYQLVSMEFGTTIGVVVELMLGTGIVVFILLMAKLSVFLPFFLNFSPLDDELIVHLLNLILPISEISLLRAVLFNES